jgi:chemotaxis protein CheC
MAVVTPEALPQAAPPAAALAPAEPDPEQPAMESIAISMSGGKGRLLDDVNNDGAVQASLSLSQFTGQDIRVSFPESRVVSIKDVAELMGGEEATVGGIYVGVQGGLTAGILLVVPEKEILRIDDLIHGRPAGTARDLAEVDLSGLAEMGNILASCFINAIADAALLEVHPEVPEISVDMCLPVLDSVIARFNQPGDSILFTEAVIYGAEAEDVVCHQLLFLEPASLQRLLDTLAARDAAAVAAQG